MVANEFQNAERKRVEMIKKRDGEIKDKIKRIDISSVRTNA